MDKPKPLSFLAVAETEVFTHNGTPFRRLKVENKDVDRIFARVFQSGSPDVLAALTDAMQKDPKGGEFMFLCVLDFFVRYAREKGIHIDTTSGKK